MVVALLIPLIFLSALVTLARANPVPVPPQESVVLPLRWLTQFGTHFTAGSELELSWSGGDETVEVYYVPRWPGQREYDLLTIHPNASESVMWQVPTFDDYPQGTTIIMGIKGAYQARGADWYDLSASLPLVSQDNNEAREIPAEVPPAVVISPDAVAEPAEDEHLE